MVQVLVDAMLACPWPLYASVLMKDAVRWRSSFDVSELVLPDSVEAAINQLLDDLEERLGVIFVSHTLVFITVSKNGLCEVCSAVTVRYLIKSQHIRCPSGCSSGVERKCSTGKCRVKFWEKSGGGK